MLRRILLPKVSRLRFIRPYLFRITAFHRPHHRLLPLLLSALCYFPQTASAEHKPWTVSLYFENDLFGETDQNYTNGTRLSWTSPDTTTFENDPQFPAWLRLLNHNLRYFHDDGDDLEHNLVLSLGQLIYTPSDVDSSAPLPNQRPYAGYLYAGIAYHTRDEKALDVVELNLGFVGPSAQGEAAQDVIHDLRGFEKYKGWDNQLRTNPLYCLFTNTSTACSDVF